MIKLEQLKYFIAAAEGGSFAAAERSIFVSANSIVRAVDILEQQLGVQLFIRKASQGLTLTREGQKLLAKAKRLLEDAQSLELSFTHDDDLAGEIVVGCADSLAWSLAPLLIERINKSHPELLIKLVIVPLARDISGALESEFDVLLTFHSLPDVEGSRVEVLAEPKTFAMMGAHHPLAGNERVSMKEVSRYPLIVLDSGPSYEYYMEHFTRKGIDLDVKLRTSSSITSWSLVSVTDMIALRHLIPQHLMSPLGKPIACVPLSDRLPKTKIMMLTPEKPSLYMSAKIEFFADCCRSFMKSGGFDSFMF